MGTNTIRTKAHFLAPNDLYEIEKPYSLRFPPPKGFPRQSTKLEEHEIDVQDIRKWGPLSFAVEGCTMLSLQSLMKYEDYDDEEKVKDVYLREVANHLRELFDARKVQIFEHRIRKRHAAFPTATGESYQYDQPTSVVHVDTTLEWMLSMVNRLNPERGEDMLKYRVQCVNVWKPISGPVKDWPLALCSANTINPIKDLVPCDIVYSDYVVENMQVYYTNQQKWFYISDQMPNEALVFLQADTKPGAVPGEYETTDHERWLIEKVPHVAIPLPGVSHGDCPRRESIELRALVYNGAF